MRRGVVVVATAVIATALAVSAALAATGSTAGKRPPTPTPIERACEPLLKELTPSTTASPGVVPESALAPYAIFRRPQAAPDHLPSEVTDSQDLIAGLGIALPRYDPADTRLLVSSGGASVYVLVGQARVYTVTATCRRADPTLVAFLQAGAAARGRGPAYCLLGVQTSGNAANVDTGPCFGLSPSFGFVAAADELSLAGVGDILLVPDGVGAVQIRSPGIATQTLPVSDNAAVGGATEPVPPGLETKLKQALLAHSSAPLRRLASQLLPTSVTWLAATGGAVVRSFARPPHFVDQWVAQLRASAELLTQGCGGSTVTSSAANTSVTEDCGSSGASSRPTKP